MSLIHAGLFPAVHSQAILPIQLLKGSSHSELTSSERLLYSWIHWVVWRLSCY